MGRGCMVMACGGRPTSSSISLAAPDSIVSPSSNLPPGSDQAPAFGGLPLLISRYLLVCGGEAPQEASIHATEARGYKNGVRCTEPEHAPAAAAATVPRNQFLTAILLNLTEMAHVSRVSGCPVRSTEQLSLSQSLPCSIKFKAPGP